MEEAPVRLKKNEFWGRRYGSWLAQKPKGSSEPWGWVFKVKRSGNAVSGNGGPTGHKLRWYVERAWSRAKRPIRNPEHQKKAK